MGTIEYHSLDVRKARVSVLPRGGWLCLLVVGAGTALPISLLWRQIDMAVRYPAANLFAELVFLLGFMLFPQLIAMMFAISAMRQPGWTVAGPLRRWTGMSVIGAACWAYGLTLASVRWLKLDDTPWAHALVYLAIPLWSLIPVTVSSFGGWYMIHMAKYADGEKHLLPQNTRE